MAKPIEYEFATIDSKEEIVVHLGKLDDEMLLGELAHLFGISQLHIITKLALPNNWEIARAFYRTVREKIEFQPSGGLFIDAPPGGGRPDETEREPLPLEAELEFDEVQDMLAVLYTEWGPGEAYTWPLPRLDLYLPLSPYLVAQLNVLHFEGPRPDRIFEVKRADDNLQPFAVFEDATKRLEIAIAAKYVGLGKRGKSYAEVIAGAGMARTIVDLQHRHWQSERNFGSISENTFGAMLRQLAPLDEALGHLEDAAWRQFEVAFLDRENAVADELLVLLDASGGPTPLHVLIKAAFMQPESVTSEVLDRVVDVTLRACNALAQSMRSVRFVREHVVDLFEEEGRDLQESARAILLADGSALAVETIEQWDTTIAALRRGSGDGPAPEPSPLRWLSRGIRAYRLGLSAVSAILEQGVVAQVMLALNKGLGDSTVTQGASRGFAQLVLRALANSAVKHRNPEKGVLFFTGGLRLAQMMTALAKIDHNLTNALAEATKPGGTGKVSIAFWTRQGDALRSLQVRPMPRTAAGASFRLGVSLIALVLSADALSRTKDGAGWAVLISASLNVGEHGLRGMEFIRRGKPVLWMSLSAMDRLVKCLSGLSAAAGLVGNGLRAHGAFAKGRTAEGVLELFGGASNLAVCVGQGFMAMGSPGMLARLPWLLRAGAILNVWGVAIGIGTFIVQVIYEESFDVGTRPILLAILSSLDGLPRGVKLRPAVLAVRTAAGASGVALGVLLPDPGTSGDDASSGKPTYWKAAKLGFSKAAIRKMFDATRIEVAIAVDEFFELDRSLSATIRVTFLRIEVLDPGLLEGDEGLWTLESHVNSERVGSPVRTSVTAGTIIELGWNGIVEASRLDLELDIENHSPSSITGEPPPSIPRFRESLAADSAPPWGEGNWSLTKGDFYTLFYSIEVVAAEGRARDASGSGGPT